MKALLKLLVLVLVLVTAIPHSLHAMGELKAGTARKAITPSGNMWLAGYAARKAPSDGKVQDLFAKALAFEDETGARFVMVTTDLLGLPRHLAVDVAEKARERFGLSRERLALTFSHTHCGPVIGGDQLFDMYGLNETEARKVDEYTELLRDRLVGVIGEALEHMEPCEVAWGVGQAGFGMNRRQYTTNGVVGGVNPIGPVDHDVPVLKVSRPDGSVLAVLLSYACHNTTLSFQEVCGDYAGFAQQILEEKLPGTSALFTAGCGADANPFPRGSLDLAKRHGSELANAVLNVLNRKLTRVQGPIRARFAEIPLVWSEPPSEAQIEQNLGSSNVYEQRRAQRLMKVIRAGGSLPKTYPYPVQFWRFGNDLQLPILGGEVVVDYSLRLKHELGRDSTWVIGYANDFMAYIPSLRVLREGGYEGGDSMVYFGHHGPWAPQVEDDILKAVRRLADETRPSPATTSDASTTKGLSP